MLKPLVYYVDSRGEQPLQQQQHKKKGTNEIK